MKTNVKRVRRLTRQRGFEKLSTCPAAQLPQRETSGAAGYDFKAIEDVVIPSIWKSGIAVALKTALTKNKFDIDKETEKQLKPVLVGTGIKAYMGQDEYLQLANRSSNPTKHFLLLGNGIGVIDNDYYNNSNNEGHIMFQFLNFGLKDKVIKKGDRIGQGIFLPFLKADGDKAQGTREGGFGSTGQ